MLEFTSKLKLLSVICVTVRGMRRYGRRRGGGGKPYHSNRGSRKTSPSPTEFGIKNGDQRVSNDMLEEDENDQMESLSGQYKGYVSQCEKLR